MINNEIEKIVALLQEQDDFCVDVGGKDCATCSPNRFERCTVRKQAKALYEAGYRNIKQIIEEFADKMHDLVPIYGESGGQFGFHREIDKLKKEFINAT